MQTCIINPKSTIELNREEFTSGQGVFLVICSMYLASLVLDRSELYEETSYYVSPLGGRRKLDQSVGVI